MRWIVATFWFGCHTLTLCCLCLFLFFFNAPPPTEIYTLSLHDALPISCSFPSPMLPFLLLLAVQGPADTSGYWQQRSEEHTSELQSRLHLVCRLLLEKKKKKKQKPTNCTLHHPY